MSGRRGEAGEDTHATLLGAARARFPTALRVSLHRRDAPCGCVSRYRARVEGAAPYAFASAFAENAPQPLHFPQDLIWSVRTSMEISASMATASPSV